MYCSECSNAAYHWDTVYKILLLQSEHRQVTRSDLLSNYACNTLLDASVNYKVNIEQSQVTVEC